MKALFSILGAALVIVSCNPTDQAPEKVARKLSVTVATEIGHDFGKGDLHVQKTDAFLTLRSFSFSSTQRVPDRMRVLFENVAAEYEGKMFQYPLVAGKTWEDNWNSTNKTTLEGYEKIEIALGTFPACLKHKTVLTGAHIGSELEKALVNGTRYMWFAKGVGLVKVRYEHSNGIVTEAELIGYEIQGNSAEYFPLNIGSTWTYKWKNDYYNEVFIERADLGVNRTKGQRFKGELHLTVKIATEGGEALGHRDFYIAKTAASLGLRQSSRRSGIKSSNPIRYPTSIFSDNISDVWPNLFQFPLKIGKIWEQEGMYDSQVKTTLEGYETIEIGAGTFRDCLKHKTRLTGATTDSDATAETHQRVAMINGTRYLWFAKGVGIVKMRYEHSNGVITEAELTEYKVPGKRKEYLPLNLNTQWTYKWQNDYNKAPIIEKVRVDEAGKGDQTPLKKADYIVKVNADAPGEIGVNATFTPEDLSGEQMRLRLNGDGDYTYGINPKGFGWHGNGSSFSYNKSTWNFKNIHRVQDKFPFVCDYSVSLKEGKAIKELHKRPPSSLPYVTEDCILWHSSSLFIVGEKSRNIEVEFELPDRWYVSTPWQRIGNTGHRFTINNQDELVDNRLLIGQHLEVVAKSGKIEVAFAVSGALKAHKDVIRDTGEKFLNAYAKVFKTGPKGRVLFIVNPYQQKGEKRLEGHGSNRSVRILMDWTLNDATKHAWGPFLGHEIFHIWNGLTALRPFTPKERWFVEGVTNYYSDITSARLGYLSEREFLKRIETACERYLSVSHEFAIGDDFRDSRLLYEGGSLVAAALDLEIRERKRNRKSLDHVMQEMYRRFSDTTAEYAQRDIIKTVNKVSGNDFEPFFQTYVTGKERLPLAAYFGKAGLNVQVTSEDLPTSEYVADVIKASLARETTVAVNAVNGSRIETLKELRKIAKHWKPGEVVTLAFDDNGKPVVITVTLSEVSDDPPTASEVVVRITKKAETTKLQRAILAGILGKK